MEHTRIFTLKEANNQIPLLGKTVVVAGGCFDVLHPGHTAFLAACKKNEEILIILLESDQKIRDTKGNDRPINSQKKRAQQLAALELIDYIVLLPYFSKNSQYDEVIYSLKPAIIATTLGDPCRFHKERQATKIGATVIDVIERLSDYSTTKLLNEI